MNAKTQLALFWALLAVLFLGATAMYITQDTYCHGQCKHDTRCQDRCIKNGCPHWDDRGEE